MAKHVRTTRHPTEGGQTLVSVQMGSITVYRQGLPFVLPPGCPRVADWEFIDKDRGNPLCMGVTRREAFAYARAVLGIAKPARVVREHDTSTGDDARFERESPPPGDVHARRHENSHWTVCGEPTDRGLSVLIPAHLGGHPDVTCERCLRG